MVESTKKVVNHALSENWPVIALGTVCTTAITLRNIGLNEKPMPFDWLQTSPSMIRHCLETDFLVLLDRKYYRSLTGTRRPDEPVEGCDHGFYAREFGLTYVFNHNDPTRDTDYRYMLSCIDRFRDVMASNQPKLFVQMREREDESQKDFELTCRLLDELTRHAAFLQIAVSPPDWSRTIPEIDVMSVMGEHTLYRMSPTSMFGGQKFSRKVDTQVTEALIANYGRQDPSLFSPGDHVSLECSPDMSASLDKIHAMAHIANRGDTEPDKDGWTGIRGSGLGIEGLSFYADAELFSDSFAYQAAHSPNEFSGKAFPGSFLGTRGLGKPIYGIRIFLSARIVPAFTISVEASFIDGTYLGPTAGRAFYEFVSDSPLEAIRILVVEDEMAQANNLHSGQLHADSQ